MWDDFFHALVPILGPTSALLLGALVWQTLCLERARRWRDENEKVEAEKRTAAFVALGSAIEALKNLAVAQTAALDRIERKVERRDD